ncbi:MAG: PTS fructose transporter subunit IIC [Thermanaerothrix sp.]|uniref:Fructose-specific PTS transporter subunit EIIC n=1 Tax=Thermanaerothrix solaris TaxID=3058434 RepID=A0ABU3NMV5_9CHLR|nr:fructose-specific PTS transporter subunit EIIC [Thermanaerothrix sp. 4228-RoL]MDT8898162.1 fructose-specific PTS transporter subunit EIIC [Thermanaerothrix sp. 4228-RoL]
MAKIVAVTSCPTGIAHTFMAAEAIEQGALALGHTIKVETQGSVGAENPLSAEDIRQADVVIIAADTKVDLARFAGKRVYQTSTNAAINDGKSLVERALREAVVLAAPDKAEAYVAEVEAAKAKRAAERTGVYKHLMTGVSYMIPFVVAGGLLIAIAFAARGIYAFDAAKDLQGNPITPTPWTTFWANLFAVGAQGGFGLMVPILAGFIAFSIADRPGLAPGMIGGVVAGLTGSGFLGGIVAGFIAGYFTQWLNQALKLPRNLQGLKPVLILPLFGSLVVGILMFYVVGTPVKAALDGLTAWLNSLQSGSKAVLGLILGAMMAFDMGGPVNKAAYTFSVGLISAQVYQPMAAVMAAGMTPPLGLALATWLFKNRFTSDEREAGKAAAVLGISFITEGAIPFAARDPLRVIPSIMVGSAVAAALSMIFGCGLRVPHGGIFVLPIPNAVENLGLYVVAILIGTVVTTAMLYLLKKPLSE